jgi:hypothetical protein
MIARYNFQSRIDDYVRGQVLHQDGIVLGGDQLVKRLLETIIVPQVAEALGLEEEDVQLLFGPEVPRNREFRAQRVNWINRLFVPLAQAYLDNAVDEVTEEPISHTDPEVVDPAVLDVLRNDSNAFVRSTAVYYLRHYRRKGKDIWPAVEEALTGKSDVIRDRARDIARSGISLLSGRRPLRDDYDDEGDF